MTDRFRTVRVPQDQRALEVFDSLVRIDGRSGTATIPLQCSVGSVSANFLSLCISGGTVIGITCGEVPVNQLGARPTNAVTMPINHARGIPLSESMDIWASFEAEESGLHIFEFVSTAAAVLYRGPLLSPHTVASGRDQFDGSVLDPKENLSLSATREEETRLIRADGLPQVSFSLRASDDHESTVAFGIKAGTRDMIVVTRSATSQGVPGNNYSKTYGWIRDLDLRR